jgi:hypothetical protein
MNANDAIFHAGWFGIPFRSTTSIALLLFDIGYFVFSCRCCCAGGLLSVAMHVVRYSSFALNPLPSLPCLFFHITRLIQFFHIQTLYLNIYGLCFGPRFVAEELLLHILIMVLLRWGSELSRVRFTFCIEFGRNYSKLVSVKEISMLISFTLEKQEATN